MEISFHGIRQTAHIGDFKPCSTNRLWVAEQLPSVDALVFLDADTMACDDLAELWRHFGRFTPEQELASTRESFQCRDSNWRVEWATNYFYPVNRIAASH